MGEPADYDVKFYERPDRSSPVVEFIRGQDREDKSPILQELDNLKEFGLLDRKELIRIEDDLWKLLFAGRNWWFHFIFFDQSDDTFIVLHGFRRGDRRVGTPEGELAKARHRLQDHLKRRS